MNQREIKFRAYYKPTKTMSEPFTMKDLTIRYGSECISVKVSKDYVPIDSNNLVVMQFTGLKDKNGKKIYEGDIVKRYKYQKGIVRFGDCSINGGEYNCYGFYLEEKNGGDEIMGNIDTNNAYEIIGNIMENPELLK